GAVKGVIGLGLPTVSLALIVVLRDLPTAMALLLAPSFVTNLMQAVRGGAGRDLVRRQWPFFLFATVTVWAGARAFAELDAQRLPGLLGLLLVAYASFSLFGVSMSVSHAQQRWVGPLLGSLNGVFTGMTGSFVVPGVLYLQSIGLNRDALVQGMGILFTLSTLALCAGLAGNGLLNREWGLISLIGVIPALLGMAIGQRVRAGLSESLFRRVFFWSLFVLGVYLAGRAFL
ncbi:MAG: sulfite exporter TauE/SafE family protein, partial [Gammaproteobacteria bacterium]|nr:sulfite exporter TauE/SafE family protein [Gammaproteobacteria bacterium]